MHLLEVGTGFEPAWTALQAAASPLGHPTTGGSHLVKGTPFGAPVRADDEIRTRDPHLGKVMRYPCATSAFHTLSAGFPASLRAR